MAQDSGPWVAGYLESWALQREMGSTKRDVLLVEMGSKEDVYRS